MDDDSARSGGTCSHENLAELFILPLGLVPLQSGIFVLMMRSILRCLRCLVISFWTILGLVEGGCRGITLQP